MQGEFNFKHEGVKYSIKEANAVSVPKPEDLAGEAGQSQRTFDIKEVMTNDKLFDEFWPEIGDNPRSFIPEEIDTILQYSQMRGKKVISTIFNQFNDTGLHHEHIERIVDHCIGAKELYDITLLHIKSGAIVLNPEQHQKFTSNVMRDFNVGAIIENLDILGLSQAQKNLILEKHISSSDLQAMVKHFSKLGFDAVHRGKLVDNVLRTGKYHDLLENLKVLKPNAEQLNLLIDKIEPRFWSDWKVMSKVPYYDIGLLDMEKFEAKVVEANQLGEYFQFCDDFKLTFEQMYDLCIASIEQLDKSDGKYSLDKSAFDFVIGYANARDEVRLTQEKVMHLVRLEVEHGGELYKYFINEYPLKLDASFLKDVGATSKFSQTVLRTKFELSPAELKQYYEENNKYGDTKYLDGINKVLNFQTTKSLASETIYTQFNNEFIIMNEANIRSGGELDPKMARIARVFGSATDIESYLLGLCIFDGRDQKQLAELSKIGVTEIGEAGLDQLEIIFNEFKNRLLKPEMTIAELKGIRESLNIPVFQHYFVNFTRQTKGEFGDKTVDSLIAQMDDLIDYYEKTGVSDFEIAGKLKEGYQSSEIEINLKSKQEFPLNPEVMHQLGEYKANMEKALSLFEGINNIEKPIYRLFQFVKAGKKLIYDLCEEAHQKIDQFDPEKIIADNNARIAEAEKSGKDDKVKINDPEKILFGLRQKAERLDNLRKTVSAKTESGREYVSPKIILDNWVEIFNTLSLYKDIPEVKNYLQQLLFTEYISSKNTTCNWVGTELEMVASNTSDIANIDQKNPKISVLERTLNIVTHLINQEFWKKVFEERNTIIRPPEQDLSSSPESEAQPTDGIFHRLNEGFDDKIASLKSTLSDKKEIRRLEEQHMNPNLRAIKNINQILGINAIKDFVDTANRHQKMSEETVSWSLQPVRGYLLEVSGKLCDACWADRYDTVNQSFPDAVFVNISSKTEDGEINLEGGFMLLEVVGVNGEKVLTIRGLNPLMASIDTLSAESLVENIVNFTKETAARIGAIPAIVIDDHSGGSCTNRPAIQEYCQSKLIPQLQNIMIQDDTKSNFNGYNISNCTYRLDQRIIKKDDVDKVNISN